MSTRYWPGDVEFWARAAHAGVRMAVLPDHFVDYYLTGANGVMTRRRQCRTIFFHTARLYGDFYDVVSVTFTKVIKGELIDIAAALCHAMGFHPLRWRLERSLRDETHVL